MPKITKEEVLHIARISAITIHDHEIPQMLSQLESVLNYAARVSEIACTLTEPLDQNNNVFREDIPSLNKEAIQRMARNAPDFQDGYFVVPTILEHNE